MASLPAQPGPIEPLLDEHDLKRMRLAKLGTIRKWRQDGRGPRYIKVEGAVHYRLSDVLTLTNGVLVLGLHGLAFIGGWIEQIGGFTHSPRLVTVGVVSSLIMPSESLWRRATFEMQSPVTRSLPFGPFSNISAPSLAMIGYAGVYLLVALAIAIHHFSQRDL